MRLETLSPHFLRATDATGWHRVDSIEEANGIMFKCPKCSGHQIICWSRSRGAPEDLGPGPGRWSMLGNRFDDLTLNADPPSTQRSILLTGGCGWHGYITNGEVQSC